MTLQLLQKLLKRAKYLNRTITIDLEKKETDSNKSDDEITKDLIVENAEFLDGLIKFRYNVSDIWFLMKNNLMLFESLNKFEASIVQLFPYQLNHNMDTKGLQQSFKRFGFVLKGT